MLESPSETCLLPPAYVVRREVVFSQACICPRGGGGGLLPSSVIGPVPGPVWGGGGKGTPTPDGVPPRGGGGGGYAAGGMPLAVTQQNFLVT